jgi:hypothetical protein
VGGGEIGKIRLERAEIFAAKALDGRLPDGPVDALDLSIGPGMLHLEKAPPNAVFAATQVEPVVMQRVVGPSA